MELIPCLTVTAFRPAECHTLNAMLLQPTFISLMPARCGDQHLGHLQGAAVLSVLLCPQADPQDCALRKGFTWAPFPAIGITPQSFPGSQVNSVSGCPNPPSVVMCWHVLETSQRGWGWKGTLEKFHLEQILQDDVQASFEYL